VSLFQHAVDTHADEHAIGWTKESRREQCSRLDSLDYGIARIGKRAIIARSNPMSAQPPSPSDSSFLSLQRTIPEGFLRVESKLEGITVYAPAALARRAADAKGDGSELVSNFKCPNCGATTAFDPRVESVTCSNCGSVYAIHAQRVGRNASEFEFTLDTLNSAPRGWGSTRRDLHCENCGANISIAPTELSNTCPFCGSNRVAARAAMPAAFRPRFIIPFKIVRDGCPKLAQAWLQRGWLYPRNLVRAARGAQFTGIYLPFWTFSAQVNALWRAEVGHEREERYFDVDSMKFKTRTVLDWKWETGKTNLPFTNVISTGTKHVPAELLEQLEPFELNALTTYEPAYLAGWRAQSYEIPLDTAWEAARARMRELVREMSVEQIDSKHVRNFSLNAAFDEEAWRLILLPVFLAAYRFQGKTYQLVINGQTGKVAGQKPVAWTRIWLLVAALVLPGVLLAGVGLMLRLVGYNPLGFVLFGGFLFVIGALAAVWLIQSALRARDG